MIVLGTGAVGLLAAYLLDADCAVGSGGESVTGAIPVGEDVTQLLSDLDLPTWGSDVEVADLVSALKLRVDVRPIRILLLDVYEDRGETTPPLVRIELDGGGELRTRRLVNTIPAPEFDRLTRFEGNFFRPAVRTWEVEPAPPPRLTEALVGVIPGDPSGTVRDVVEFGGAVYHLGKWARWDRRISLADVVRELYEMT